MSPPALISKNWRWALVLPVAIMTFVILQDSKSTTEPLPLPPFELLANSSALRTRYNRHPRKYRTSRVSRPFIYRLSSSPTPDTPSSSFYRLYDFFVLNWNIQFRNELEYFCCSHPEWSISSIPDPADHSDPVRYTILAVLSQLMCDAFNRRVELGLPRDAPAIILDFEELQARPKVYEEVPDWAKHLEPLAEKVYLPDAEGIVPKSEDEDISEEFKRVNIIVQMPHIHFV